MIFAHTHERVMNESKARTSRVVGLETQKFVTVSGGYEYEWDADDMGVPDDETISAVYTGRVGDDTERLKWQVGKTYAVQPGRTQKGIGRIRITAIRREHLQDITPEGVYDEGMRSSGVDYSPLDIGWDEQRHRLTQFGALWNGIHEPPYSWSDNPLVWVLEFVLVKAN